MQPHALDPSAARPASLLRAGILVAPLMALGNGLNYVYNIVMARMLGPAGYGALGALLALALIASVPGLGLQVVVARHTALRAREPHAVAELWSATLAGVVLAGVALALLVVVASPLLDGYLRLGSLAPALWLAASVAPLPALSAVQGMLQGRERFAALAVVLLVAAAGKLAAGVALVALGTGVNGAIAAVAVGPLAAVLLALVWVRPPAGQAAGGPGGSRARPQPQRRAATSSRAVAPRWTKGPGGSRARPQPQRRAATSSRAVAPRWTRRDWARLLPRGLGREVTAATGGILGVFVLANVDVLLARHHLGAAASGLYAAGAVVAKIAYWAPQFVVLIVFPRMVTSRDRGRLLARSAACVAAFGALLVVAAAAAPRLAAAVPFGQSYLDVGPTLPLFAALGTCLALVQLVLFSGIASADARLTWLLFAAVAAEVAAVSTVLHHSVAEIVTVALTVAAALLAGGWLLERGRDAAAAPAGAGPVVEGKS